MKLSNIFRYQLFRQGYIIQLSPVRTGSTLVYNLLRGAVPGKKTVKQHTFSQWFGHLPMVATVRHPYDSIASLCRVKGLSIDDKVVRDAAQEFWNNGASDILIIRERPNVLILHYEKFIADYDYIYSRFEEFFSIRIDEALRAELTQKYNLKSARKIADANLSFENSDSETKIHGQHISDNAERIGYAKDMFTGPQLAYLNEFCAEYMRAFCYEAADVCS